MTLKQQLSGDLFYQATIRFTNLVEYGTSMQEFTLGKTILPPEGMRFDQTFEGELHGPKLTGTMTGTDYLYVRADGQFQLHLHARVITDDGVNITFSSSGLSIHKEGERSTRLRATVSLFSSAEAYKWVNSIQLWAIGELDPVNGTAEISAYIV